jgi:hypothetical protein
VVENESVVILVKTLVEKTARKVIARIVMISTKRR